MNEVSEIIINFQCRNRALFGILHCPLTTVHTGFLILVGGPQYRVGSHRMFVQIARILSDNGLAVFRFDYRGMGDSEGTFPGFQSVDADIRAAVDQLNRSCPTIRKVVLLGLCDGATAAALYAPTDRRVSGVVLLNPWVHTEASEAKAYLWHYYPRRLLQREFWRMLLRGRIRISASASDFAAKARRCFRSRSSSTSPDFVNRMCKALTRFDGPIYVIASENDLTAAEFRTLWSSDSGWRKIRTSAHFSILSAADHTLSSNAHIRDFCALLSDWLGKGFLDQMKGATMPFEQK